MQDCDECVRAPGQFGDTMLHEAISDDQAQRNRRPTGDWKSTRRTKCDATTCHHAPRLRTLAADDHYLPAGLAGFHEAMRFADLLEAEHARRLGLEPPRRHVLRDFLQRNVGQREPW